MNIVLFTHPDFQGSESMPRYARMLSEGLEKRGHRLQILTAQKLFYNLPSPAGGKKWLGYIDQFFVFPLQLQRKLKKMPDDTFFVFADHALGPWIPWVAGRPHVIHCHDFLAQRSALGKIPENKVSFTGKLYQALIRRGYRKGKNFISISRKTRADLHTLMGCSPRTSRIVYNGLNQNFEAGCVVKSRQLLQTECNIDLSQGFILHIGGNQFYKNRKGVLKIYSAWRKLAQNDVPLLMLGSPPTYELLEAKNSSGYSCDIHFISNVSDRLLKLFYQGASLLLFPSLDEGFGWPIAEAMASGCPVVTTGKAPMNEVGRNSCFYIPPYPDDKKELNSYYERSANVLDRVMTLSFEDRNKIIKSGLKNSRRFNTEKAIEKIESIYKEILTSYNR